MQKLAQFSRFENAAIEEKTELKNCLPQIFQ